MLSYPPFIIKLSIRINFAPFNRKFNYLINFGFYVRKWGPFDGLTKLIKNCMIRRRSCQLKDQAQDCMEGSALQRISREDLPLKKDTTLTSYRSPFPTIIVTIPLHIKVVRNIE